MPKYNGLKDDRAMFALFALFNKAKKRSEHLTAKEKRKLEEYSIHV